MERQDIVRIAISVMIINIMLAIFIEGSSLGINPSDSEVNERLANAQGSTDILDTQIEASGLCTEDVKNEADCLSYGCLWIDEKCVNAVEKKGSADFGFFDVIQTILKIPLYIGKLIKLMAMVVFYEIVLSYKLSPLITNSVLLWLVNILLWTYQAFVLYFLTAFILNNRGGIGTNN